MKRFMYVLLLPLFFLNCKKEKEPAPLPAIKEIVGKWRWDAVEKTVNGQKVWEKVSSDSPSYLVFRFDGVILDGKGLPYCCTPDSLVVNGIPFKIKPLVKVPDNPGCATVYCFTCPSWDLVQKENELVVASECEFQNYRYRYLRE